MGNLSAGLVVPLALAATECFSPEHPAQLACGVAGACPAEQTCVDGVCTEGPGPYNLVFVTSTLHAGDLGGLAGADAICAERAQAAGQPGTYVAWLSTSSLAAKDRLVVPGQGSPARAWIRRDGAPFADRFEDLEEQRIYHPIAVTEDGARVAQAAELSVWTGTDSNGSAASGQCSDWTSTTTAGRAGRLTSGGLEWTGWMGEATSPCGERKRLYCFGIDHGATALPAPPPAPPGAKRIFLSDRTLTPGPGISVATADALCSTEAGDAGLEGTYDALLATTLAAASTALVPTASYYRLDDVRVGTGAELSATDADPATGVWQHASRFYLAARDRVWTGATLIGQPGTPLTTCGDWGSSGTSGGICGDPARADRTWWNQAETGSCTSCRFGRRVYCVEQ